MKIRRLLQGLMAIVLLGASTAALHAQDFRVFVEGGVSSLRDKQYYNVYGASFASTYKAGNSFTVGAEYPIFKTLSAEGSYSRFRNNLAVTNYFNSTTPNEEIGYGIQGQRVMLDANAHSAKPFKKVRPYLVFGLDLDRFAPTSEGAALAQSRGFNGVPRTVLNSTDKLGYNFGFGLDISLTHMLAVKVDARDHRVATPAYGLPQSASSGVTAYYPVSGKMNDLVYSAGFVIHFDL
ncbi:MAG TPA: outer membrane beta-barrel protein [Terriglobia bacterium]|nr:outer membrane beta-barrel protein [Terriglobia bacterium]